MELPKSIGYERDPKDPYHIGGRREGNGNLRPLPYDKNDCSGNNAEQKGYLEGELKKAQDNIRVCQSCDKFMPDDEEEFAGICEYCSCFLRASFLVKRCPLDKWVHKDLKYNVE